MLFDLFKQKIINIFGFAAVGRALAALENIQKSNELRFTFPRNLMNVKINQHSQCPKWTSIELAIFFLRKYPSCFVHNSLIHNFQE